MFMQKFNRICFISFHLVVTLSIGHTYTSQMIRYSGVSSDFIVFLYEKKMNEKSEIPMKVNLFPCCIYRPNVHFNINFTLSISAME